MNARFPIFIFFFGAHQSPRLAASGRLEIKFRCGERQRHRPKGSSSLGRFRRSSENRRTASALAIPCYDQKGSRARRRQKTHCGQSTHHRDLRGVVWPSNDPRDYHGRVGPWRTSRWWSSELRSERRTGAKFESGNRQIRPVYRGKPHRRFKSASFFLEP